MSEKIRISVLTNVSIEKLAKKMELSEIREMANLYTDVVKSNATIEQYREKETHYINKYNFTVK
jgi:pyrroline-5-carboxylate reductase